MADKLQRVLNSAARIVPNMRKFDRGLTHFRRNQLHWLDVVDRVLFRVCVQVFRCLHKMAPEYLSTYCQPVSGISGRRHRRWPDRGHLDFPRVKLASYGGRSSAYAGLQIGTHFMLTLDTIVVLFCFLSATLKPFSSLSTRLAHAARWGFFYKNALYKFTVIIIIPLWLRQSLLNCLFFHLVMSRCTFGSPG